MLSYEKFVRNIYDKNIQNGIIITKEKLFKKIESSIFGGVWGNYKDDVKEKIQFERSDIIFGLEECVIFTNKGFLFVTVSVGFLSITNEIINVDIRNSRNKLTISENKIVINIGSSRCEILPGGVFYFNNNSTKHSFSHKLYIGYFELLKEVIVGWYEYQISYENQVIESKRVKEKNRIESLNQRKSSILTEIDKDNDGNVDLVDCESFVKLLNKNQKSIIEIDKTYVQKFVKISMYIKTKRNNIQQLFLTIKKSGDEGELNELVYLLRNQIHTYDLMIFHSINMLTSLINNDLLTFYEIYECFDQTGVFNSNWENEVSSKLSEINVGIKDLMYSIQKMEDSIVNSINNMTYITQESFKELNDSVNQQLSSIDSSIKFNNLLTGIQTYQMYKINKNIKSIN